jgi:hypothetical protein
MTVTIKCTDCKQAFTGKDEYEAELAFNNHDCPNSDDLWGMSMEDLRALAYGSAGEKIA